MSVSRHRLYQEDCACVLGHYIKDLSILGRDLAKTAVLDNAPHTYPYHVRAEAQLSFFFFDFNYKSNDIFIFYNINSFLFYSLYLGIKVVYLLVFPEKRGSALLCFTVGTLKTSYSEVLLV